MSRLSQFLRFCPSLAVISLVLVVAPTVAFAQQQNNQSLIDRLERLERDIRTLNVQIARGGTPTQLASGAGASSSPAIDGPAIARLGARMDSLESDLRVVTGSIESVNHQVFQITDRLEKLVSDIDFRLSALEGQGQPRATSEPAANRLPVIGSAPSPAAVQSVAPAPGAQTLGTVALSEVAKVERAKVEGLPTAVTAPKANTAEPAGSLPAGTVKEQYTYAFNLLRQTNYDQAEVALKAFIATNGDEPLASNARYWLGETYYVRRSFNDAAQIFYQGFSKDPTGPKAADSLLKLGMSLGELGQADDACAAFSKVLSDFPKATSSVKNAVARERKRSSCP